MPKPLQDKEAGTVLLSTLLMLSLMSAVTLALLTTMRLSVDRTAMIEARAQAALYANGARDFARAQIDEFATVAPDVLNRQLLAAEPIMLPFEGGSITLNVSDGSHCFRLSALADSSGVGSDTERQRLNALIQSLGAETLSTGRLGAVAVDWIDADSQIQVGGAEDGVYLSRSEAQGGAHRTANVPMQSITELRALEGMTEALFRQLAPHVCIGEVGQPTRFNLNTAQVWQAPVLASILGGGPEAEQLAIELIENRPVDGYRDSQSFLALPRLEDYENPAAQLEHIIFQPYRISVETVIRYGAAEELQFLAFEGVDSQRPRLAYQGWGLDEFPSIALARLTDRRTNPGGVSRDR